MGENSHRDGRAVLRRARMALAAAAGGALLVPAALPAANPPAPVTAQPNPVVAGSTPPPAAPGSSGPGAVPATPPPDQANVPAARASGPGPTVPGTGPGGAAPARRAKASDRHRQHRRHHQRRRVAVAAGSTSVSIQGFAFHPPTISLKAGDTVTWTNEDSASHTATANDGSFNTGVLKKGQSASHTFSKAGTFAYICAIHPNMKGTVVVAAAASGGGGTSSKNSAGSAPGSSSATAGSPGTAAAAPAFSRPTLPRTGLQLAVVALLGAAMLAGGALLRRLARP